MKHKISYIYNIRFRIYIYIRYSLIRSILWMYIHQKANRYAVSLNNKGTRVVPVSSITWRLPVICSTCVSVTQQNICYCSSTSTTFSFTSRKRGLQATRTWWIKKKDFLDAWGEKWTYRQPQDDDDASGTRSRIIIRRWNEFTQYCPGNSSNIRL